MVSRARRSWWTSCSIQPFCKYCRRHKDVCLWRLGWKKLLQRCACIGPRNYGLVKTRVLRSSSNSKTGSRINSYRKQLSSAWRLQAQHRNFENGRNQPRLRCEQQLQRWHPCSRHRYLHLVKTQNFWPPTWSKVRTHPEHLRFRHRNVRRLDQELRQPR